MLISMMIWLWWWWRRWRNNNYFRFTPKIIFFENDGDDDEIYGNIADIRIHRTFDLSSRLLLLALPTLKLFASNIITINNFFKIYNKLLFFIIFIQIGRFQMKRSKFRPFLINRLSARRYCSVYSFLLGLSKEILVYPRSI